MRQRTHGRRPARPVGDPDPKSASLSDGVIGRKPPVATAKLARLLCKGLHGGSTRKLPCWILLDAVLTALAIEPSRHVDDAIAYAAGRGWLKAEGKPVHSLTITAVGVAMLKPVAGRKPGRRR